MLRYELRLYHDETLSARRDGEPFEFEAKDDADAVERATTTFAGELAACHHAMLSSSGGRVIWQKR
jgi:hypothetical protein